MGSPVQVRQQTYDPPPGAALPDPRQVPGVARVETTPQRVEAVTFDTDDRLLARHGICVGRVSGGDEEGWWLLLPGRPARLRRGDADVEAIRAPLGRATRTVPKRLRDALHAYLRGTPARARTTVSDDRCRYRLLDAQGRLLAEVHEHAVSSPHEPGDGAGTTATRVWRVLRRTDATEAGEALERLLAGTGAGTVATGPAASPESAVAHLLGARAPEVAERPRLPPGVTRGSAGEVLYRRLRAQVDAVWFWDPRVRLDLPDAVHQMRVALRRLRSALVTFRPLVDRGVTEPLRDEVRWLAAALGDARDAEVLHERLAGLLADQPPASVRGPVVRRLDEEMTAEYRSAHEAATSALSSHRYLGLLDALDALAAHPPLAEQAREPAQQVVGAYVLRDFTRLRKRVRAADAADDPGVRDERLHEVRKAAKRLRYAAETVVPVFGRDAARLGKAAKRVQSVLGDQHDAVVAQAMLLTLADRVHDEGGDTFTYGRLHVLEQQRSQRMRRRFRGAWRKARRTRLRRRLS